MVFFVTIQCEKEYHVGCLQSQWQVDLKVSMKSFLFDHPCSSCVKS